MIVRTWCLSRIELTRARFWPWVMGWIRALGHPIETVRVWRREDVTLESLNIKGPKQ